MSSPTPTLSSSFEPSSSSNNDSFWPYDPLLPPSIVFTIIYALLFFWIAYLTFIRYKSFYFTVMPLGTAIEVVGYALRCYATQNQNQLPPYITSLSLTVLAPLLFAAGNYLLLPRLVLSTPNPRTSILKIPTRRLTLVFISLDILAFLIQGAGTSIAGFAKWTGSTALVGVRVLVGGLGVQVLGVGWFLSCVLRFYLTTKKDKGEKTETRKNLVKAVGISGGLIFIRCIYRFIEFVEGVEGYVIKAEWMFWVFEAAMMVGCVVVFCFWHPGKEL
ncbi:RTA1 like protein-domain-containing protein [Podospora fimiseda]|uniref:RTA1 like protein-domain-containing protein n=1 Tax=Podospora fimiseda TaxID=252190 RepID=A0AAN7C0J4_9PEZI|nr:RTA1 like protein-domain-containing protein [Podospora fimiseda]